MEQAVKDFVSFVALGLEAGAGLIIGIGAIKALYRLVRPAFSLEGMTDVKKGVWIRFATWLVLGLEFELGADVLRTAISPSWTEIGQLGAIAGIRTFLNYFLEKDIDKYAEAAPSLPENP